jgi:hypothetical protein
MSEVYGTDNMREGQRREERAEVGGHKGIEGRGPQEKEGAVEKN